MRRIKDRLTSKKKVWIEESWDGNIISLIASFHPGNPNSKAGYTKYKEVPNFEFDASLELILSHGRDYLKFKVTDLGSLGGEDIILHMYASDFIDSLLMANIGSKYFTKLTSSTVAFIGRFYFDFSGSIITIKPVKK